MDTKLDYLYAKRQRIDDKLKDTRIKKLELYIIDKQIIKELKSC